MPGRGWRATHCKHGHELTPENRGPVVPSKRGGGSCRTCAALASRRKRGSLKVGPINGFHYKHSAPERVQAEATGRRWCSACRQAKSPNQFYRDRTTLSGFGYYCKDCNRRLKRSWRRGTPEHQRATRRRLQFGITVEQHTAMLTRQGGVCAICKRNCSSGKALAVDHDHKTGRIRGLLCGKCNQGIGLLGDDAIGVGLALDYLNGK